MIVSWALVSGCASTLRDDPQVDTADVLDEAAALVGRWEREDDDEGLDISDWPRFFVHVLHRQIGSDDDPGLPYPTVCSYRYETDDFVLEADADPDTYTLHYSVQAVTLRAADDNDPVCGRFIARQQARVDSLSYDLDLVYHPPDGLLVDGQPFRRR